jgi:hypothetical protein
MGNSRKGVQVAHARVAHGEPPIPTEVLAESIVELSQGMHKLREGRLNDKAIGLLLSHSTGLGQRECLNVLNALGELEEKYLKKAPK